MWNQIGNSFDKGCLATAILAKYTNNCTFFRRKADIVYYILRIWNVGAAAVVVAGGQIAYV